MDLKSSQIMWSSPPVQIMNLKIIHIILKFTLVKTTLLRHLYHLKHAMFYISILPSVVYIFLHLLYLHSIKGGWAIFHVVIFKLNRNVDSISWYPKLTSRKLSSQIAYIVSVRFLSHITSALPHPFFSHDMMNVAQSSIYSEKLK